MSIIKFMVKVSYFVSLIVVSSANHVRLLFQEGISQIETKMKCQQLERS